MAVAAFALLAVLIPVANAAAATGTPAKVVMEGQSLPGQAYINADGRALLPVRFVLEALGFQVHWIPERKEVSITNNGMAIKLWVGRNRALVDSQDVVLDTQPVIEGGRVLVPLRFVAEALGLAVDWNSGSRCITLNRRPEPKAIQSWLEVTGSVVNIRSGPGTSFLPLTQVPRGTKLQAIASNGGWFQVALLSGDLGWISASYARETQPPSVEPDPGKETGTEPGGETEVEPGAVLQAIDFENSREELSIEIKSSEKVQWRTGKLTRPDRLYVDLSPAYLAPDLKELVREFPEGPVSSVRTGQYDSDTARLVFDLRQGAARFDRIEYDSASSILTIAISPVTLGDRTVVLDPGHGTLTDWGGIDPGAIGPGGVKERDVVQAVAEIAAGLLRKNGVNVLVTTPIRSTVSDLNARAELANNTGATVFVSIHANAALASSAGGTTTYYYVGGDLSGQKSARSSLAQCLQRALISKLGLADRGIQQANFLVLRATNMPSALVELAFISNPKEERLLADPSFQADAAQAIADGVMEFLRQGL